MKTLGGPQSHVRLGCHTCRRYHDLRLPADDPTRLLRELESWDYKHPDATCRKPFPVFVKRDIPRDLAPLGDPGFPAAPPWWHPDAGFRENNNFQTAFVASAALTITSFNSLASDSSLLAGASSAVVDNGATGAPLEIGVSAQIKPGTTPTTAKEIDLYAWAKLDDTVYPDAITGSDAAITASSTQGVQTSFSLLQSWASSTTTGGTYPTGWVTLRPVALSSFFGGWLPRYWGVWLVHNEVAALAASGHVVSSKGSYVAG